MMLSTQSSASKLNLCNIVHSSGYWPAFFCVLARFKGFIIICSFLILAVKFFLSCEQVIFAWIISAQDHMRRAGDVCFAEVYREGGGKPDFEHTFSLY